ncbi:MAG: hypothetical protein ACRDT1_03385 [Micromonosporaceae bacterium]
MDYADFSQLAKTTIRGMYDRIPAKYHEGFEDLFIGGELRLAVEDLVGGLHRFDTAVTPVERENLSQMLTYLGEPVSKLDGIRVEGEGHGESVSST